MKHVLVIAAHPDDELLGEGGTIRRLVNEGVCARAVILAEGLTSRLHTRSEMDELACRPVENHGVRRIYAFETPSSTEWNYTYEDPFTPNVFFDVSETLDAKIRGMSCYRTENTVYPHPRSAEALEVLGKYRGSNVGYRLAEGFMLLREIVPIDSGGGTEANNFSQ